jgi:hypothetical protein
VSTLPMDQAVEVYDAAGSTAGAAPALIQLPSVFGTVLGTMLLSLALRRSGFGSWLAPIAMTLGWVVFLAGAQHFVWAAVGTGLLAAATALVGLRILYASDLEWETGIPD